MHKAILALITIMFVGCGETKLINVLPANFYQTNLTEETQHKVDVIFSKMALKTKSIITLHKVDYNPEYSNCNNNTVAFDSKYKMNGVEWDVITFCQNPNTMATDLFEQTLWHELGHSVCHLKHTENGLMKAIGFEDNWQDNKEQLIDEMISICVK